MIIFFQIIPLFCQGPVEIFSRGRYISDLEVYDFEEDDEEEKGDEGEKEEHQYHQQQVQENQTEEPPSIPPSLSSALLRLSNGFGESAPRSESGSQEDSLVSLMQRALQQLGAPGTDQNLSTTQPSEATSSSIQRTQGDVVVTSRGDSIMTQGTLRHTERQPVLFGGLTAAEHDQARDKYLGDRKVTLKFGQRGDIDLGKNNGMRD